MNLEQTFSRIAFYQVLMGILTFCYAEANPGMLLIAGSMLVLSRYVSEGPWRRPLPRWTVNLLAITALTWMFSRLAISKTNIIITMGHFTMWLQVLVMFARKGNREYGQVLLLSLLQMIGASVLSVSIIYGLLLAVYCILALLTVLMFHLKSASDRIYETNRIAAPDARRVTRPKQVTGRGFSWQFRLASFSLVLACAAVGAGVFVLMPRAPDYSITGRSNSVLGPQRVGFSQQVRLDGRPIAQGGNEPVMNVRVELYGQPHMYRSWLMRGAVLDLYDPETRTWKRSDAVSSTDRPIQIESDRGVSLATARRSSPIWHARITLRQTGYRNLFTILPTTQFNSDGMASIVYSPEDLQMSVGGSVLGAVIYDIYWPLAGDRDLSYRYRDDGPIQRLFHPYRQARRQTTYDPETYARGWPVQTDRIAEFTRQILENADPPLKRDPNAAYTPDDDRIAHTLADYLRKNYRYQLNRPRAVSGEDPLINFIFDQRYGHCELFASALAAMTRSIGMQSRVITGYLASEYNQIGDYYVIRQSDAHAWVEINLGPDNGWRSVDATPAAQIDREHRLDRNWKTVIREVYEYVEFGWIRSVVAYDTTTRQRLLTRVNQRIKDFLHSEDNWLGQAVLFVRNLPTAWALDKVNTTKVLGSLGVMLLIGAVLLRSVTQRRRRLAKLKLISLPQDRQLALSRQLAFYVELSDLLARHGHLRGSSQNPRDFAKRLADQKPTLKQPLFALTDLFYRARFGGQVLTATERKRIRVYLRQLHQALTNHPPA